MECTEQGLLRHKRPMTRQSGNSLKGWIRYMHTVVEVMAVRLECLIFYEGFSTIIITDSSFHGLH